MPAIVKKIAVPSDPIPGFFMDSQDSEGNDFSGSAQDYLADGGPYRGMSAKGGHSTHRKNGAVCTYSSPVTKRPY